MKNAKWITLTAISLSLIALDATAGQTKSLKWRDIVGIVEAGNLVGRGDLGTGTDGIIGGAPWSTLVGNAKVDPDSGRIQFQVRGLVLAAGSNAAFALAGLPIGTPDGVTDVMGTLVCNVDGTADGSGTSTIVNTPSVHLSSTGDAQFNGKVGAIPDVCTTDPNPNNVAFLIRIFDPVGFRGVWIANGAVLDR